MRDYFYSHVKLEHLLCVLVLIGRIGDIGSTYLVTPTLQLEANPIMKRLGWWFAIATLLTCLVPYYSTAAGIIILIPSLMISASNIGKIWFVRVYGETAYLELLLSMAKRSRLSHALLPVIAAATFIALIGLTLLLLSPDPSKDWGYWFGFGFLAYAFTIVFYGSLSCIKLFKMAHRVEPKNPVT